MKFGGYTTSDIEPDYGHLTKYWNFWNSRWRQPPSWKSLFRPLLIYWLSDISEILHQEAEQHADEGRMTKTANFQNPNGGRPSFWKSLNHHISIKNREMLMKFGTHYIRYWTRLQSRDQKLKFLKFEMVTAAILKIAFLAITHQPIIRYQGNFAPGSRTSCRQRPHDKNWKFSKSNLKIWTILKIVKSPYLSENCPILMKLGTLHQILNAMTASWQKLKFL